MNVGDVVHRSVTLGLFGITVGLAYFTVYESAGIVQRRVVYKQPADLSSASATEALTASAAAATIAAATTAATKK